MDEEFPDHISCCLSIEGEEECLSMPKVSRESGRILSKVSCKSKGMPTNATSSTNCKTNERETSWIDRVRKKVNLAHPMDHCHGRCTMFKVPKHIRELDPKAYTPTVASFGPFHHHNPYESSVMMDYKWRSVQHLLSHHGSQDDNQLLDRCLLELKKQDHNVRRCYAEEFSTLDAEDMALIMLLDGCFIIYLMLKMQCRKESSTKEIEREKGMEAEMEEEEEGDVVINIEEEQLENITVAGLFTLDLVVYDLLKLENQIPFFIIKLLFDQLISCEDEKIGLVDLALQLFKDIHPEESESFKKKKKNSPSKYKHLLHLFHSSRIPSEQQAQFTSEPESKAAPSQLIPKFKPGWISDAIKHMKSQRKKAEAAPPQGSSTSAPRWTPSATEIHRAGVKFKRKKPPADSFLNITFEQRKVEITPLRCLLNLRLMFRRGRMEIPSLQIYDYTGPLFQNLIAFEQCYFNTKMYITIYALFMDCIIDQAEDVRLLHLEGILEHKLSNDQAVAQLFNKLGSQIHFDLKKNYLTDQIQRVNKFYDSKWHKTLAALRRDYLGNPWATISVLAAIFLLLLSIEQAVFSALSFFHS
uniref:UPF0481 protein At3g47200-like n=1 Tax=Elaeis guineensis var. tenera TaxID=51953 RepID=A0A8N4ERK6_ELAGV|nr:UPF0481 protein At3g47200-like [Elaeis guineensis]